MVQSGEATVLCYRQGEQVHIGNLVVAQHARPVDSWFIRSRTCSEVMISSHAGSNANLLLG
ncbi:hypothetical protein GALL_554800 [mine drainage metagenome]|uniref:Uncharacterized protein n=1 Tax=mine drainage metagenome TaxID=410659 RepID=A0A1J5NW72_9ZZZZ